MLKGRKSSFLDKLWRTSLKLPATPHTSLKRSISREVIKIITWLFAEIHWSTIRFGEAERRAVERLPRGEAEAGSHSPIFPYI